MSCIAINRGAYYYTLKDSDEPVTPYYDVQAQATTAVMALYQRETKMYSPASGWPRWEEFYKAGQNTPDGSRAAYTSHNAAYKAANREFRKEVKALVASKYQLRSGKIKVVPFDEA